MTLLWFAAFPVMVFIAGHSGPAGKNAVLEFGLLAAGVVAYYAGGLFPVLCHLYQERTQKPAGESVGRLYFMNVMGATFGPLLTGFMVFEYVPFPMTVLLYGLAGLGLLGFMLICGGLKQDARRRLGGGAVLAAGFGVFLSFYGYGHYLEKLQFGAGDTAPFRFINESRSGFVTVDGRGWIFGNGAYDGTMNLDPGQNINGITRFYATAAFHPGPMRVLDIGLSGGSNAKILSMSNRIRQVVSIEINKGYLDIIRHYPKHATLLTDPKVRLVIDDGRRWLRNHPNEMFDVITANTMYHWRSNATNVLSREFMMLCRKHLKPGGFIYFNSTGSDDVAFTAAHVFPYVSTPFGAGKMVLAGGVAPAMPYAARLAGLESFHYADGRSAFTNRAVLHHLAALPYPNMRDEILSRRDLMVITDDNMASEFKRP